MGALHSPRTAVIDFGAVTRALADDVGALGGRVATGRLVTGIRDRGDEVTVTTRDGPSLTVERLVVYSGLQSDRLAALAGLEAGPRTVPFRGRYLRLRPERRRLVRAMIYPVPDSPTPSSASTSTGAWTTRCSSAPMPSSRRRGRATDAFRFVWADARDCLGHPGFWRLARQHWRTGTAELAGTVSRRAFLRDARRFVPELAVEDVVEGPVGIRAQAVERSGEHVDDFRVRRQDRVLVLDNAPSPAAPSSLAIGQEIATMALSDA